MKNILPYIAFSLMLLVASCTKKDDHRQDGALALDFDAVAVDAVTKAVAGSDIEKTTTDNLKNNAFGVYGAYSEVAGSETYTNVFLSSDAQRVYWSDTKWIYDNTQYWKLNQFYRFRAYHPYTIPVNALSTVDDIFIEYAINERKDDLLVGFQSVESTAENIKKKVKFDFNHALCALEFKIAFKNDIGIEDDYTDNLTSFYLSGLVPTGTLHYTHETGNMLSEEIIWYATYFDNGKYYEWTGAKALRKYDGSNATTVFDGDGVVFCIPQTCSPSASKQTSVYFMTEKPGLAVHSAALPPLVWEPGKIYSYTLLINKSDLEINVSIKDWDVIQANEDLFL